MRKHQNKRRTQLWLDPELQAVLDARPYLSASVLPENIDRFRQAQQSDEFRISDNELRRSGAIEFREVKIPSCDAEIENSLLVLRPTAYTEERPGLCFFHGGGMIAGDSRTGIEAVLDWVEDLGIVVASTDYRLAPEHPHPVPVEDCYQALVWLSDNRAEFGIDDKPLLVAGASAGGGLAAGVALLSRDRGGPEISDQVLMCPMLDDAGRFPSNEEPDGGWVWGTRSNMTAWKALLGAATGGPNVSAYAAPSRATQLAGLPHTYIDVGGVEIYRDEAVDFGTRLAQAGTPVELHVWGGAFHGFDLLAADSQIARIARVTRTSYLRRRFGSRVGE